MKTVSKALLGTMTAGAMAVTSASPAFARDRNNDGISAGEVIAGAVILGGIAAIASSIGKDRSRSDYRYDRDYRDDHYRARGNPRTAVERCVSAAQQNARRYGYRKVRVTDIRDVDDTRYGWRVKGRISVDDARGYNDRNQRGYRHDARYNRGRQDTGSFTCDIQRGRVVDIDYNGIRGLH